MCFDAGEASLAVNQAFMLKNNFPNIKNTICVNYQLKCKILQCKMVIKLC